MTVVRVKTSGAEQALPEKGRPGDAGFDLRASRETLLEPGRRTAVGTGVRLAIPEGLVGLVRDRSGLALKNGLHVLAGVIDPNYRGEVMVVLINLGRESYLVRKGERVAQLLFLACPEVRLERQDALGETGRGDEGFGSSGK